MVNPGASRVILGSRFIQPQHAPPLAQSSLIFAFGIDLLNGWLRTIGIPFIRPKSAPFASSGGHSVVGVPNLSLNSDPACIVWRSFS